MNKPKKTLADLTSNQMYRAMNRRFDARVRFLRRFGFVYESVGKGLAALVRVRHGKTQAISASLLLTAPNRLYRDFVLRPHLTH